MPDMKTIVERGERLFSALTRAEWVPILVARVSVGYMFLISGWGKLHKLHDIAAYFRSLGIPAPELQAPFVSSVEFLGGLCLILGIGARVAAPMLAGTMVVALMTVQLKDPKNHDPSNLFYVPEWLLLVILIWLAFSGAGKASLDRVLYRKLVRGKDTA